MLRKLLSLALPMVASVCMAQSDQPILSFGVMTDLHNQQTLISGETSSVQLRGTVNEVLEKIKAEENLDLLVLNGDFTSDVTISEENWLRVRELIVEGTRSIFPEGAKTPVLYCNGNHEYEVAKFDELPKPYNAGDFYSSPMKTDIGELSANDCFYEYADNGTLEPMKLLAAYHYVIEGFDFVVLNTGKHFFKYAWDYQYSIESVQWVADKLAEIHADDPNKTVFFLAHLPFGDSNSISSASKGLKDCEATTLLKQTLAGYPNLIYIYGHDHGKDSAFIRTETAQRVTQYDTKGAVYTGSEPTTTHTYFIKSSATGKYLGRTETSDNIETFTERMGTNITASEESTGSFSFAFITSDTENNLHIGSSGRYSGNSATEYLKVYEVTSVVDGTATGTLVEGSVLEDGKSYLIVGYKNGSYYACTNEKYASGTNARLVGAKVTLSGTGGTGETYVDSDPSDDYTAIWDMEVETETIEPGAPSFISTFAGSMRYYSNSINSSSSVNNSDIAQALMVYVYQDSVVLQMKNYAKTGYLTTSIYLAETPAPYVIKRNVVGNGVASRTVSVASSNPLHGTVGIKSPAAEGASVTTEERVIVEAIPANVDVSFEAWVDADGNIVSTANPFTYNGTTDIALTAQFAATTYPALTHSFQSGKQQENRFLDRVTYTVGEETKEVFNLNLGKDMLSAFPENVNTENGGNALISYLDPAIEVKQGASGFDLTCYSTHYSITTADGTLYKNNMTWVNQAVYVDWNCDYDFLDANELYEATDIAGSSSSKEPPVHVFRLDAGYTRTVALPEGIAPGEYRMYVVYGQNYSNDVPWSFDELFMTNNIFGGNAYEFTIKVTGSETGIEAIDNEQPTIDNSPIYDLSGRRVLTPQKGGVYVKGGKKVIY